MSGVFDACLSWEAHIASQARFETFGHLAPKKHKLYHGKIVYALGMYDCGHLNPTVLFNDFDLDSPWFYDAMIEFLSELQKSKDGNTKDESGKVFEWVGTFCNYKFIGKRKLLLNTNNSNKPNNQTKL